MGTELLDELRSKRVLCVDTGFDSTAAHAELDRLDISTCGSIGRHELFANPKSLRQLVRDSGAQAALLTSRDWGRQSVPQMCQGALMSIPVPCYRLDIKTGDLVRLPRLSLAAKAISVPFVAAWSWARTWFTARALSRVPIRVPSRLSRPLTAGDYVLVIWLVRDEHRVGGSISHISGILEGFRTAGLKVGLVAQSEPPAQIMRLIDDLEMVEAPEPMARILPYIELIAINENVIPAAQRLADRIKPAFVYQRHAAYLTAGAQFATQYGVPFVLEQNGPEVWCRMNWATQVPGEGPLLELAKPMEKYSIESAALVAAVSTNAGKAANEESDAHPSSLIVSPNAVSAGQIETITAGVEPAPGEGIVLGWVGTFGPWHGAPMVIRALERLPQEVTAVMVGAGEGIAECRELAASLGVSDRVDMPGALPHDEALRRLSACHILVSPHVPVGDQPFFGSPTKLFEFMALGRPIVASDLEQIGEILNDGVTAVLVEPGNLESFVSGVQRVLALPDKGRSLGMAAKSEAEEQHTWDGRAGTIIATLESQI